MRSRTESGYARIRGDAYFTEPRLAHLLLRVWREMGLRRIIGKAWEPCCGAGDIVGVLRAAGIATIASDIKGAARGCRGARAWDFLQREAAPPGVTAIITNPPYQLADKVNAETFVRHALRLMRRARGIVAMLLPNDWDTVPGRRDLLEHPAFRLRLTLQVRPQWIPGELKATPRRSFVWFIWDWRNRPDPNGGNRCAWVS